jgi:hypothetical protein
VEESLRESTSVIDSISAFTVPSGCNIITPQPDDKQILSGSLDVIGELLDGLPEDLSGVESTVDSIVV